MLLGGSESLVLCLHRCCWMQVEQQHPRALALISWHLAHCCCYHCQLLLLLLSYTLCLQRDQHQHHRQQQPLPPPPPQQQQLVAAPFYSCQGAWTSCQLLVCSGLPVMAQQLGCWSQSLLLLRCKLHWGLHWCWQPVRCGVHCCCCSGACCGTLCDSCSCASCACRGNACKEGAGRGTTCRCLGCGSYQLPGGREGRGTR
jgi:hypothetical protein